MTDLETVSKDYKEQSTEINSRMQKFKDGLNKVQIAYDKAIKTLPEDLDKFEIQKKDYALNVSLVNKITGSFWTLNYKINNDYKLEVRMYNSVGTPIKNKNPIINIEDLKSEIERKDLLIYFLKQVINLRKEDTKPPKKNLSQFFH